MLAPMTSATGVESTSLVRAASLAELRAKGRLVVRADRHTLCLFAEGDEVHAVDNRCPHMGFPLHRGTIADGILTCHWHHARFDLSSGGTFDQWADDLRRFPVELRGDDVYVDLATASSATSRLSWRRRRSPSTASTRPAPTRFAPDSTSAWNGEERAGVAA